MQRPPPFFNREQCTSTQFLVLLSNLIFPRNATSVVIAAYPEHNKTVATKQGS
jgi:hypothetical protein